MLNDQLDTLDSCPSSPSIDFSSSMKSKKPKSRKNSKTKSPKEKEEKQPHETVNDEKQTEVFVIPTHIPADNAETSPTDDNVFELNMNHKMLCDKSTAPSPTHSIDSIGTSMSSNWARERELESTNEDLQEKLKDTEERLQSLRIQYDSLSQIHRVLRENHMRVQEESDKLKIDYQILEECANVLR